MYGLNNDLESLCDQLLDAHFPISASSYIVSDDSNYLTNTTFQQFSHFFEDLESCFLDEEQQYNSLQQKYHQLETEYQLLKEQNHTLSNENEFFQKDTSLSDAQLDKQRTTIDQLNEQISHLQREANRLKESNEFCALKRAELVANFKTVCDGFNEERQKFSEVNSFLRRQIDQLKVNYKQLEQSIQQNNELSLSIEKSQQKNEELKEILTQIQTIATDAEQIDTLSSSLQLDSILSLPACYQLEMNETYNSLIDTLSSLEKIDAMTDNLDKEHEKIISTLQVENDHLHQEISNLHSHVINPTFIAHDTPMPSHESVDLSFLPPASEPVQDRPPIESMNVEHDVPTTVSCPPPSESEPTEELNIPSSSSDANINKIINNYSSFTNLLYTIHNQTYEDLCNALAFYNIEGNLMQLPDTYKMFISHQTPNINEMENNALYQQSVLLLCYFYILLENQLQLMIQSDSKYKTIIESLNASSINQRIKIDQLQTQLHQFDALNENSSNSLDANMINDFNDLLKEKAELQGEIKQLEDELSLLKNENENMHATLDHIKPEGVDMDKILQEKEVVYLKMKSQLESLQNQVENATSENRRLLQSIHTNATLDVLFKQIVQQKENNEKLIQELNAKKEEVIELSSQLDIQQKEGTSSSETKKLNETIEHLEETVEDLKNQLSEKDQIIDQCHQQYQQLNEQLEAAHTSQESIETVEKLKQQLLLLNNAYDELKAYHDEKIKEIYTTTIQQMEEISNGFQDNIKSFEEQYAVLYQKLSKEQSDNDQYKKYTSLLKEENQKLYDQFNSVNDKLIECIQHVLTYNTIVDEINSIYIHSQDNNETYKSLIPLLQKLEETRANEVTQDTLNTVMDLSVDSAVDLPVSEETTEDKTLDLTLSADFSRIQSSFISEIKLLKDSLEEKKIDIDNLNQQVSKMKEDYEQSTAQFEEQLKTQQEHYVALQADYDQLNEMSTTLTNDNNQLTEELAEKNKQMDSLKEEFEQKSIHYEEQLQKMAETLNEKEEQNLSLSQQYEELKKEHEEVLDLPEEITSTITSITSLQKSSGSFLSGKFLSDSSDEEICKSTSKLNINELHQSLKQLNEVLIKERITSELSQEEGSPLCTEVDKELTMENSKDYEEFTSSQLMERKSILEQMSHEELMELILDLEEKIRKYQLELANKDEEIELFKEKLTNYESFSSTVSKCKQLEKENKDYSLAMTTLQKTVSEMKLKETEQESKLSDHEAHIQELTEKMNEEESTNQQLESKIEEKNQLVQSIKEKCSTILEELFSLNMEQNHEKEEDSSDIEGLLSQILECIQQFRVHLEEKQQLQTNLQELTAKLNELESTMATEKAEFESKLADYDELSKTADQYHQLMTDYNKIQEENEALQSECNGLRDEIKELNTKNESQIEELQEQVNGKKKEIEEMEQQVNELNESMNQLREEKEQKMNELNDTISVLNNTISDLNESMNQLREEKEQQINELNDTISKLNESMNQLREEKEQQINELNTLMNQLREEKEQKISELNTTINELNESMNQLREEKEQQINELNTTNNELNSSWSQIIEGKDQQINELNTTISELNSSLNQITEEKEQQINELNTTNNELNSSWSQIIEGKDQQINELSATIQTLSSELQQKNDIIDNQFVVIQTELNEQKEIVENLKKEKQQLKDELDQKQQSLSEQLNVSVDYQKQKKQIGEVIAQVNKLLHKCNFEKISSTSSLDIVITKIHDCKEAVRQLNHAVQESKEESEKYKSQIEEMEKMLEQRKDYITTLETKQMELSSSFSFLSQSEESKLNVL